jgi:deoxyribose-phosphate aldolase
MDSILKKIQASIPDYPGRREILRQILSLLDLTTLEGTDNDERIKVLCNKALSFGEYDLPLPAAVCVYPPFIKHARKLLDGSGVKVASVVGAFPSGQLPLHLRVNECSFAVSEGAHEVDMVISRGAFLAGNHDFIKDEVAAMKQACGDVHLKVILETGELGTIENIKLASELAVQGGADFIKTSTGKIQPAATPEAMFSMLQVIHQEFENSGKMIGIKPAGGISTPDQAMIYYLLVKQINGDAWLNNQFFRIGASRLADGILAELQGK